MKYLLSVAVVLLVSCTTDFEPGDVEVEDTIDTVTDTIEETEPDTTVEDPVVDDPVVDTSCESAYLGGECNVFEQCGCPTGQKCDFQCDVGPEGTTMYERCVPVGEGAVMEPCIETWECGVGMTCGGSQCVQFCLTSADCPSGLSCRQFLTSDTCGEHWESDAIVCWP